MLKMIFLVLGLAVGFGGGVYWASKNPEAAGKISAEEERRFLEAQLAITEKIKAKLDQLSNNTSNTSVTTGKPPPGSVSIVSGAQSGAGAAVAADVKQLKNETENQTQELKKRIETLKK